MYVNFDEMNPKARVWVYQSNRRLSEEEVALISQNLQNFCEQWAAHGAPLQSSYLVYKNQFVVLTVDEGFNAASGCSIDSSVEIIRQLEQHLSVSFFERTQIAFINDDEVFLLPMNELKNNISSGRISQNTLTFNNLVKDVGELKESWQVEAGSSWLKRYFV
ncbi:MAG: hypothetical protein NXI20_08125 [bacterium]|nr:hypothetical protein [bacterium]